MLCDTGVLSLRYIYTQTATPALEVQNFGMITQTQLEIRRVIFGIDPDDPTQRTLLKWKHTLPDDAEEAYSPLSPQPSSSDYMCGD